MMEAKMPGTLARTGALSYANLTASLHSTKLAARMLDRVIFYALLALLALAVIPYGASEPWWDALVQCSVFMLATLWMIEGWLSGKWRVKGWQLLLPLSLLVLFAFAQSLSWGNPGSWWQYVSADPYETRLVAFKILALSLALALFLRYTSSIVRLRNLTLVVIGIGVVSAVFGISRHVLPTGLIETALPQLAQEDSFGQFLDLDHFAYLMEMSLGLTLGLILSGGISRRSLALYSIAAGLMGAALFMTDSRGGALGFVGLVLFFTMLPRARPAATDSQFRNPVIAKLRTWRRSPIIRGTLGIVLFSIIVVGVIWMTSSPVGTRLTVVLNTVSGDTDATAEDNAPTKIRRLEIWRATWELIQEHPVFGSGFGGYRVAVTAYNRSSGKFRLEQAHNDYMGIVARGGVIAAALAGWFILGIIVKAREHLRAVEPARRAACYGALAGLFAVAVHSFVDYGLHVTANALVFVALVVIATVNIRIRREDKQPDAPSEGS